jgi:monoamine oxidase
MRLGDSRYPVELGGMRFLTSHTRVTSLAREFGVPMHPFDASGAIERTYFAGHFGLGEDDPNAAAGYDLSNDERDRSATDLVTSAFNELVPGASSLDDDEWSQVRRTATWRGRRLVDWSIRDALLTIYSPAAVQFIRDAIGYDSGPRAFNVADAIQYFSGGGDPSATAVTPDEGMDAIPKVLVRRFVQAGGELQFGHELQRLTEVDDVVRLDFASADSLSARHVVLATAKPAFDLLVRDSPALDRRPFSILTESLEAFPAFKLYMAFDRPWWREATDATRLTMDLPSRKLFYRDSDPASPAALLAAYTDGLDTNPWADLAQGVRSASPAPDHIIDAARHALAVVHPTIELIPRETTSAYMYWGSDPHETGWSMWRPGFVSDDVMELAAQPDKSLPVYVCGEGFSHKPAWVEGALESADFAVDRLLSNARA